MTNLVRQTILDVSNYHRPTTLAKLNQYKVLANDNPEGHWTCRQRDKLQAEVDLYDRVIRELEEMYIPPVKSIKGHCIACTCQECGEPHDQCICEELDTISL